MLGPLLYLIYCLSDYGSFRDLKEPGMPDPVETFLTECLECEDD